MKQSYKSVFIVLLLIYISLISYGQIWPFRSMIRFGNTVYYKIDSLSNKNLKGTSIVWHDTVVSNRFFDILSKIDSIKIKINDSVIYFHQKKRSEPKNYKEILFYSHRKLTSKNVKIKYLELTDLNQSSVTAIATMKIIISHKAHIVKEKVAIPKSEIEGVFLGIGKKNRTLMTFVEIAALLAAVLLEKY